MRRLLEGGYAPLVHSLLRNVYMDGTYHHRTVTKKDGGGLDESIRDYPCKVQDDRVTEGMRQAGDFVDTDRAIILLASGLPDISTDGEVTIAGRGRHRIMSAEPDAMRTHWLCRVRRK